MDSSCLHHPFSIGAYGTTIVIYDYVTHGTIIASAVPGGPNDSMAPVTSTPGDAGACTITTGLCVDDTTVSFTLDYMYNLLPFFLVLSPSPPTPL